MSEHSILCRTQAKRERLASEVTRVAESCGATVTRGQTLEIEKGTLLRLDIAKGPYRLAIDFDGKSKVGAFLGHWHTETRSEARYPADFGSTVKGTLNTFHFGKATTCEESWSHFVASVEAGLSVL